MRASLSIVGLAIAIGLAFASPAGAQDSTAPPIPALLEPTFLLSTARIVDADEFGGDGVILGTTRELAIRDQSLTVHDRVLVPRDLRGRALGLGDMIQFYRIESVIHDPWTAERLGRLLVPTGVGTVDSLASEVARVRLTHGFLPVLVGDYARPVGDADTLAVPWPDGVSRGIERGIEGPVVAAQQDKAILPPFDRVLVRTPAPSDLAPGEVILVDRPGPVVDGRQLPDIPLGRAMIVRVEGRIAAAVLYETYRSDLAPGDRFRREGVTFE